MGTPIKTYICATKCFHNNRLWTPGETLNVMDGKEPPKHFVSKNVYKAPVLNEPPKDPRAYAEWERKQNAEALRAVGHGRPVAQSAVAPASVPAVEAPENAEGQAGSPVDVNEAFQ